MELELGLKITKTRDDITSISELHLAKDRAGPVFLSRETDTMFILTAHLKGYRRNNIYIKINEDGSQISISGEKPIQELVKIGLVMLKKDVDIAGFSKAFRIPDGVILDRIDAKYDQEESILKIFMPKLVKGICGIGIEELKEEERDRERLEANQNEADQVPKKIGETSQGVSKESEVQETEKIGSVVDQKMEEGNFGKRPAEANGAINGDSTRKDIDESKIEEEGGKRGSVGEDIGKEGFEVRASELDQKADDLIPKIQDTSEEVSEDSGIQQIEETQNVVEKTEGGESKKMLAEDSKVIEEKEAEETKPREDEEQKFGTRDQYDRSVRKEISEDGFDGLKTSEPDRPVADHIPDDTFEIKQDVSKESDVQQKEEIEGGEKQMDGEESESLQEEQEKKSPQELDLGIPQREIPPTTDTGTHPKIARTRSKEGEKGRVKDDPGTKVISSPEIQRKETSESGKHSVNQDIPKVKKATEDEETEQCTRSMDNTKTVQAIADSKDEQLQLPRLPSAQQSEVEESKELSRKPEDAERKGEPEKAPVAFPDITSMEYKEVKPKNEIDEPYFKGLSLPTTEIKSKEREECGHHTEVLKKPETEASEIVKPSEVQSLPSTQQSIDEGGKSETEHEASRESLKETPTVTFQEPNKTTTEENEEMKTLEPHIIADESIEEKEEFGSQKAACGRNEYQEKVCEGAKGPEIVMEDRAQQQMQEKIDKEGFEPTKVADEELMERGHEAQTLPDKSEGPKPANMEESKEVSKLSLKTTPTVEDKKLEVEETTPEFEGEKFHETKQVSGKMQETLKREHKKEPVKAPPGRGAEPPETIATCLKANREELKEVKPTTENEKSQTKENEENSCIHLQAGNGISEPVTSETEADHRRDMNVGLKKDEPESDTDKSLTKELAHPSEEMLSKEAYEIGKPSMDQDASKADIVPLGGEEKEPNNSVQGTEASEDVADEVATPATLPSLPSTQIFEVHGKEQTDECYDGEHGESQESTQMKPETDQQDIKYDLEIIGKEESFGEQLIQEETGNEQEDRGNEVNSQVAASDEKKDDKKRSKKLCAPLIILGSTFLVSVIVFFVHHRRARKRCKRCNAK